MRWPQTERGRDLAALGFIALVLVVLLWPVTFGGKLLLPADMLMIMQPWKAYQQEMEFDRVQTPFLDSIQQAYPWRKFAAEQLRQDTIPLWNPYMFCGTPFVANNQSAIFYPETWLFALMPPEHAFGWAALLSLFMGGTFMFYFLRALGLRRSSSLVGVIPFLLSGFMVGWMLLPTIRAVPMWLPLMLLAVERLVAGTRETKPVAWAAILALATGMQFLAGHLHASFFVLLIVAAYALFRVLQLWLSGSRGAAWTSLGWIVAAAVTGTGLAMLQLLPVLELAGMNPRAGGMSFADIRKASMVPLYLLTALMPNLFGNPVDYNFWGYTLSATRREWVETAWYIGAPTLVLMVMAVLWGGLRRSQMWFWAGLWLGGVGMAWGTGLYYLFYAALPPLRQLPGVSRGVLICCFAGAVLGAYGFEALSRRLSDQAHEPVRRAWDRTVLVLGLVAIIAGIGVWLYTGQFEDAMPGIGTYTLAQAGLALGLLAVSVLAVAIMTWALNEHVPPRRIVWGKGLLIALIAADLLYFAAHFLPAVPARFLHAPSVALQTMRKDTGLYRMTSLTGNEERGIDRMPPNLTMAFGFQDLQGSDSLVFEGFVNLWNTVPKDDKGNPMADSPILGMLNCKYLLTSLDLSRTPGWVKVNETEVGVWENQLVTSRARMAGSFRGGSADEALNALRTKPTNSDVIFSLPNGEPAPIKDGAMPVMYPWPVTEYEPNTVTVSAHPAPGSPDRLPAGTRLAAPFVLADIWYPGWHAYADGAETPLYRANYILRGVWPKQPAEHVRFVYYPASFMVGGFVSCVCLMLIVCGLVMGRRRL